MILRGMAGRHTTVIIRRRGDGFMYVRFVGSPGYQDPTLSEAGLKQILSLMENWRQLGNLDGVDV